MSTYMCCPSCVAGQSCEDPSKPERFMPEEARSCPCTYVTPCCEQCSCANRLLSAGCRRCCGYGSDEQRLATAERLAGQVDEIDRLNAALDDALNLRRSGIALIDIMRRRYGREARQWQAHHDQRVRERDAAAKERDALKVDRDRVASLYDEACQGFSEMHAQHDRLLVELGRLTKERNDARANARILAHAYENDCRPLARAVKESLAYPVRPEPVTLIPSRTHGADYTRTVLSDNEHDDYDWVDLDWCNGPVRSIALVPRDDLGRDNDLLEVRTLGWQDKHEYQHVRLDREDLQVMLDYIDGKPVLDFQNEPKTRRP